MTCKDCQAEQEACENRTGRIAYYRVDIANAAIIGCPKHVKIMIDKLNGK